MGSIEAIAADQCEAVWPLSVEAGWNQNVADWRFMLGAGRGFGCRGEGGKWEASSLVLPLGDKLAWISMVLVTKARRRSGVGSRLLERCIAEVQESGAVAGLDATEQGRPIYLPLGFRDLYKISRWHFGGAKDSPSSIALRPLAPFDLPAVIAYDCALSGMDRPLLLTHLAGRQPNAAWVAESGGTSNGIRDGTGRAGCKFDRPGRRRQRSDGSGIDRQGSCVGPRPVHYRCARRACRNPAVAGAARRREPARLHADDAR